MGDKESREPLRPGRKLELAASRLAGPSAPTQEVIHAHELVLEEAEAVLSPVARKGYIRIGQDHGGLFWARWKWTQGALGGKYTFGSGASLALALDQMCERVYACESGKRHAHTDEGYRPKR